jgi:hypothetical protein
MLKSFKHSVDDGIVLDVENLDMQALVAFIVNIEDI